MAYFELTSETDGDRSWRFGFVLVDDEGRRDDADRTLHLAWADYNHWAAAGTDAPAAVAGAVLSVVLGRLPPAEFPRTLDASSVRRLCPDADARIPRLIRPTDADLPPTGPRGA